MAIDTNNHVWSFLSSSACWVLSSHCKDICTHLHNNFKGCAIMIPLQSNVQPPGSPPFLNTGTSDSLPPGVGASWHQNFYSVWWARIRQEPVNPSLPSLLVLSNKLLAERKKKWRRQESQNKNRKSTCFFLPWLPTSFIGGPSMRGRQAHDWRSKLSCIL